MKITASKLGEDIVPEKRISKLANLKKRGGFVGDPDDIIGMDWSKEWTELR